MEDAQIMECHPPREPIWHWPAIVFLSMLFPGLLILAGLVIVSELVTNYNTPAQLKVIFAIVSAVLSVALMAIFLFWERDRWYWALDKDNLIGGRKRDKVFPLSSIATIVPGLPDETLPILKLANIRNPELLDTLMPERKLALLLKFADGSFMPFHVRRCAGGIALMTELIKRLEDRIGRDYQYSKAEVKALRAADWNRVVR
jgi:hypothetical protein